MSPAAGDVSLNVMVASNTSRNKQRNVETSVHVSSEAAPTEFVEKQRHRDIRQSEETIAEKPQLIQVVKSMLSEECLSTGHPEVMQTDGEQCAVTISIGEPVEAKQQSDLANASFIEVVEPMELDQGQCENEIFFCPKRGNGDKPRMCFRRAFIRSAGKVCSASLCTPTEEMMEID